MSLLPLSALAATLVAVDLPPARLINLLPQLEKSLSRKLAVSSELANDVVAIRASGATDTLLEKIAFVTGGTWKSEGATQRLVLSAKSKAAIADGMRENVEKLRKTFASFNDPRYTDRLDPKEALKLWRDRFSPTRPASTAWQLPTGRAVARSLVDIDPRDLANLALDEKVVYSTRPNALQRPLGKGAKLALESFASEFAMVAAAEVKVGERDPTELNESTVWIRAGLKEKPAVINLIVTGRGLEQRLDVFGASGRRIFSDSVYLQAQVMPPPPVNPLDKITGSPTFSSRSIRWAKAVFGDPQSKEDPRAVAAKWPDDLRRQHRRPEEFDPASFAVQDWIASFARATGKNVVALIPYQMVAQNQTSRGGLHPLRLHSRDKWAGSWVRL